MTLPTVQPSWLPVPVELDMPRKTKRPVIKLGPLTVRALSGEPGAYRWRAEWYPQGAAGKMQTASLSRVRGERFDRDEAVTRAAELLAEGRHLDGPAAPTEERSIETVQDLLELWLGVQKSRVGVEIRQRTWLSYFGACRRLVDLREFALLPLGAVGEDEIRQCLRRLLARYADTTARLTYTTLRNAWSWAQQEGLVGECPHVPVRWRRPTQRVPTLDEVTATLEAMQPHRRHRRCWEAIHAVRIILATGARPGELALTRLEHINLQAAEWSIPAENSKTGARRVPLNPDCIKAVQVMADGRTDGPLWRPGLRVYSNWSYWILKCCDQAEIERWNLKSLRHLACTRMLAAGVDVATAASITGHTPQVLLETYAHVFAHRRREAVAALGLPSGQVIPFPSPLHTPASGG